MRRFLKIIFYFIITVVLLIAGLAIYTQTRPFKNWLAAKITDIANQNLNGEFRLGRIDGNLISNFILHDMSLVAHGDTLFAIPRLTVRFAPKRLLQQQLVLHVVTVESPRLMLVQQTDTLWNFSNLLRESLPADTTGGVVEPPAANEQLGWSISLNDMQIRSGAIDIRLLQPVAGIPEKIRGLDTRAEFQYSDERLLLDLKKFALRTEDPILQLDRLAITAQLRDSVVTISELVAELPHSKISGDAYLVLGAKPTYAANLHADPIDFDAMRPIYPEMPVVGRAQIRLQANYADDNLDLSASINRDTQNLRFNGQIYGLSGTPGYDLSGESTDLNIASWLPEIDYPTRITSKFTIKGQGTELPAARADARMSVINLDNRGEPIERIYLDANYGRGNLAYDLEFITETGRLDMQGKVRDLAKSQIFDVKMSVRRFNLAPIFQNDSLQSNLNFRLAATGRSFDPAKLTADLQLDMQTSTWLDVTVDTLFCTASIAGNDVLLDTLEAHTSLGRLFAAGMISPDDQNDLRFRAEVDDLQWFRTLAEADTLHARGQLSGYLYGLVDELNLEADLALAGVQYNATIIDTLQAQMLFTRRADTLSGEASAELWGAGTATTKFDSLHIAAQFQGAQAQADVDFNYGELLQGSGRLLFIADSVSRLQIPELAFRLKNQQWQAGKDTMHVFLGDSIYTLQNVRLVSGEQRLEAEGTLALSGEQLLLIKARRLRLADLAAFAEITEDVDGLVDFDMELSGNLDALRFDSRLWVTKGRLAAFNYRSLDAEASYADEVLSWTFIFTGARGEVLNGDGFLPIDLLGANNEEFVYMDRPIRFYLGTTGIDISFLQPFLPRVRNLRGSFVSDINLQNTLADPEPVGRFRVVGGAIELPSYGLNYRNILVAVHVNAEKLTVQQFVIDTEPDKQSGLLRRRQQSANVAGRKGRMWVEPGSYIAFDSSGVAGGIHEMKLNIEADEFVAASYRDFNAVVSGKVDISGEIDNPRFSGQITTHKGNVYLPWLENSAYWEDEMVEGSLLTRSSEGEAEDSVVTADAGAEVPVDYFDRLQGTIRVDFPRNFWIRSPEMNIELAGSLELVKRGIDFQMPFGTVRVVRGTYDVLNAYRFDLQEGEIVFAGGEEMDPQLNLRAKHVVRGADREKREITLRITGRMMAPEFGFLLDGQEIDGANAISWIVLGRPSSGAPLQSPANGEAGQGLEAGSLLRGVLFSQLTRGLSRELSLDMLQITGGDEDLKSASIIIGKYITDNLFVSIEKSFEGLSDRDIIAIELELSKFLAIQGTAGGRNNQRTGIDLLFKIKK